MQELIERLKRNIEEMPNEKNQFTQGYKAGLSFVIECATNSLEKEKEQILQAFKTGYNVTEYDADDYFDLLYNQNK